jgi:hypothetical protein
MRLLLCCLALTACDAPTEPVGRRSADLTVAWEPEMERKPERPRDWFPCAMRPDTSVIVIDGVRYLEILYQCY